MRWAGHVARRGRGEAYAGFWWGNLRERDRLEVPGVDGRVILRWKWDVVVRTGQNWLRIGTGAGHFECGNEPSGSIKCREFLD